jgi:hypothetical protein
MRIASDAAEIDLRPGGEMVLRWDEHGSYRARVEAVEPPAPLLVSLGQSHRRRAAGRKLDARRVHADR